MYKILHQYRESIKFQHFPENGRDTNAKSWPAYSRLAKSWFVIAKTSDSILSKNILYKIYLKCTKKGIDIKKH